MVAPPETDREYAYFHAIGSEDATIVTGILKLEPSSVWNVGDTFEVKGNTHLRPGSSWRLDSGLLDRDPLSDHVAELLRRLEPKKNQLQELQSGFRTEIVCVAFVHSSFDWTLEFDLQRRATSLGISFRFDFYPFGDLHEEIVGMRELLQR
ncbi:DUF4279 domain-containing protein [Roseibium sp. M-1]